MKFSKDYHRGHLPHYYPNDAVFFITFRLTGSLPRSAIRDIRDDLNMHNKRLQKKLDWEHRFTNYDRALEKAKQNSQWLLDKRAADKVASAIHYQDGKDYDLAAYCIMPNHVHVVFGIGDHGIFETIEQTHTLSDKKISQIMHSLKGYTSKEANRILGRSGPFWEDESYDHVIQNDYELERIVSYILDNPVKSGLVENREDWKWSYSRFHTR
jgi:putative transposase